MAVFGSDGCRHFVETVSKLGFQFKSYSRGVLLNTWSNYNNLLSVFCKFETVSK